MSKPKKFNWRSKKLWAAVIAGAIIVTGYHISPELQVVIDTILTELFGN